MLVSNTARQRRWFIIFLDNVQPRPSAPESAVAPLHAELFIFMDPASPEARTILRAYDLTYNEVIFYEFHHQIGTYVSRLVLMDKTEERTFTDASFSYLAASRWYNCDGMGSCHDYVSGADEMVPSQMDPFHSPISALATLKAHPTFHRPDEIKYVWRETHRWTIATALFFFVRYSGPPETNPYTFVA